MAVAAVYGNLSTSEHSVQLRKAVIASTIGTTIEWYDFFIYGTAAGLIFGKLYFPNEDPLTATLAAFGTYFVGFIGRPIGAAIFGHYGDRIGRKATLIATLLCMGIATFLIAFVPTYASIGIWGAVLLTILRMISGHRRRRRMGRIGAAGDGVGAHPWSPRVRGLVAAIRRPLPDYSCRTSRSSPSATGRATSLRPRAGEFRSRFPIILAGIGLRICSGILETPVFKQLLETNKIERAPILEVVKKQPREIILSALLRMAEQAPFYIFTAFIFAYRPSARYICRVTSF